MTEKQIEAAKDTLHKKYYGNGCMCSDNLKQPWSKEDKILEEELSCRGMINSILIYGSSADEGSYSYDRYLKPYYEGDTWRNKGLITKARVLELIEEQKADFAKAIVRANVYEDSEGCTYNSCVWADEM